MRRVKNNENITQFSKSIKKINQGKLVRIGTDLIQTGCPDVQGQVHANAIQPPIYGRKLDHPNLVNQARNSSKQTTPGIGGKRSCPGNATPKGVMHRAYLAWHRWKARHAAPHLDASAETGKRER